jgi:hypothetical protein
MTEQWKERIFTDSIDLIDVDVNDFPFVLAYSHSLRESVCLPPSKLKEYFITELQALPIDFEVNRRPYFYPCYLLQMEDNSTNNATARMIGNCFFSSLTTGGRTGQSQFLCIPQYMMLSKTSAKGKQKNKNHKKSIGILSRYFVTGLP